MREFSRSCAAKTARRAVVAALPAAFGVVAAFPGQAAAQTAFTLPAPPFSVPFLPSVSGNWTVMIGASGASRPDFEGTNHSKFAPVPIFAIRRPGTVDQFRSPRDNASIAIVDFGDFRAGPVGKFVSSRKASRYSELSGLADVNAAFELGGFVEYFPVDWFRVRNETRQGLGGHHGIVSDFSADFIVPVFGGLTVSAGPRFTVETAKAVSPYFSIDTVHAMATGLPVFDAKGGAHSAGVGAQLSYRINPKWEVHSYVEYDRLLGDAAKSPIVTVRGSANQTTFGVGASYSFDVKVQ
ncbi:outer membrane protein [Bradyrhizobium sp. USDA 4341]